MNSTIHRFATALALCTILAVLPTHADDFQSQVQAIFAKSEAEIARLDAFIAETYDKLAPYRCAQNIVHFAYTAVDEHMHLQFRNASVSREARESELSKAYILKATPIAQFLIAFSSIDDKGRQMMLRDCSGL